MKQKGEYRVKKLRSNLFNGVEYHDVHLLGVYKLLEPLSHIGETRSIESFLIRSFVNDENMQPRETFKYQGNAIRGAFRDCVFKYFCDKLNVSVPKKQYHQLFSGGSIDSDTKIDIEQHETLRMFIPALSILGTAMGDGTMRGKMKPGNLYPLIKENQNVLPDEFKSDNAPPFRKCTQKYRFNRTDDEKNGNLRKYLADPNQKQIAANEKLQIEGEAEPPKNEKKKDQQAQQMLYYIEGLNAGTILVQHIYLCDVTELELGAWVSGWAEFAKAPFLGGNNGKGFGLCTVEFRYQNAGDQDWLGTLLSIGPDGRLILSAEAKEVKEKYDQHLLDIYDKFLVSDDNKRQIVDLMSGVAHDETT